MIDLFDASNQLLVLLGLGTLAVKLWALVDAAVRPAPAYVAASKLTKPAWVGILAAAAVLAVLLPDPLGLFGLVGLVAAIVYLVDVRPAVREMRPGGPWA